MFAEFTELTGAAWTTTLFLMPRKQPAKATKHLFKGSSRDIQVLAKQAHQELRQKARAQWWEANQQKSK